ncbi:MAG TPA: hypothetical protein VM940_09370 [Chthoniobacterales bacterium]|jgi:hypothetical protein|nr:hypothetical protein [Chthoniobacterales bacterium]
MDALCSYLNDHLAGSVGALELMDRLVDAHRDKPMGSFFETLRGEIQADQDQLKGLLEKLGGHESSVRKAGAWIAEKLSRPKIDLESDPDETNVGLLLALEALVLGITGKRSLWRALGAASRTVPELARLDYSGLEKRAIEQCERVEAKRLELARTVFLPRD